MAQQAEPAAPGAFDERRRYPGVRSFEELDQVRFFGRTRATQELLLRVLSVRLLLQFAPSGAGKTSLLNAGLYPLLRPHGYFPCNVRLNRTDESLTQAIQRSLQDAAPRFRSEGPGHSRRRRRGDSAWALLAGTQLWSRELLLLTPVLVFDQFEEVFTLRDEAFRKVFAKEIGALSTGSRAGRARSQAAAPALKIILSLREEYLGQAGGVQR